MLVRNVSRAQVLGTNVKSADRFWLRLRGLMFRRQLSSGEGLLISPCNAVHTHFMRFPIDILFLDGESRVVRVVPDLHPWRHTPVVRGAVSVLELPAGCAGATVPGDQLELYERRATRTSD